MNVARLNEASDEDARRLLLTCLDAPQWADRVLAGRPYDTVGEVEAAMVVASAAISDEELEHALARHPRIGERADADRHDAAHSTREQSGVDRDDADLARRLEEGNRAYEDRFGRVRGYPLGPGFWVDGRPVVLVRPKPKAPVAPTRSASSRREPAAEGECSIAEWNSGGNLTTA